MKRITAYGFALIALAEFASAPAAQAWGCKGHQTVALIAEKHLTPEANQMVQTLLKGNPIDPALKRYCGDATRDAMADASTWPDDVRGQAKNGPWHYIDIPRGAKRGPLADYCGSGQECEFGEKSGSVALPHSLRGGFAPAVARNDE